MIRHETQLGLKLKAPTPPKFAVALVDDDPTVLFALSSILERHDMEVRGFASAAMFLNDLARGIKIDCAVVDVRMPGLSGIELLQNLMKAINAPPLILITGFPDIDLAITAIKAGAQDLIVKPVDEQRLVASIRSAATAARISDAENIHVAQLQARVSELRDRHRQVLDLVVDGLTSKQIGDRLGISVRTVENYRATVMDHVGVGNIAQLVRMALRLKRSSV